MRKGKTVESAAFDGARTQSARKHSIFRSMLTTHRQASANATGVERASDKGDKEPRSSGTQMVKVP